jgi:hypothetical protein
VQQAGSREILLLMVRVLVVALLAGGCGPLMSSLLRSALDNSERAQNLRDFAGCRLSRENGELRLTLVARADDGAAVSYQYDSRAGRPDILVGSAPGPMTGRACLLIEPSRAEYMRDFGIAGEKAWHFADGGAGRAFLAPITTEEMRQEPLLVVDVPKSKIDNPTLYVLVPPDGGRRDGSLREDRCLLCRQSGGTELIVPMHRPTGGEKAGDWIAFLTALPTLWFFDALLSCHRR